MKFRETNKVGKFEVKKVKNKGGVSKNVVRVAISPRSPQASKKRRAVLTIKLTFLPFSKAYISRKRPNTPGHASLQQGRHRRTYREKKILKERGRALQVRPRADKNLILCTLGETHRKRIERKNCTAGVERAVVSACHNLTFFQTFGKN